MTRKFDEIRRGYVNNNVVEKYDKERFSSLAGRVFNFLEKSQIKKTIMHCRNKKMKTFMDIPCGTGRITSLYKEVGVPCIAADISEEMLNRAKERLGEDYIVYRKEEITKINMKDSEVDVISCIRLLHHLDWEDRVNILEELRRVTRKFLILNISWRGSFIYKLRHKIKLFFKLTHSKTGFDKEEFNFMLGEIGFAVARKRMVLPLISEDMVLLLEKK